MNQKILGSAKALVAAVLVALAPYAVPFIQEQLGTAHTPAAVAIWTIAGFLVTYLVPNKKTGPRPLSRPRRRVAHKPRHTDTTPPA
jgi:hypothetical protein